MSVAACAERVRRGDGDRFLSAMTAPPPARAPLFVLYAFNLEIARAPWLTAEPDIARMRLQFWRQVIEEAAAGAPPRAHEVAGPLAGLIAGAGLPAAPLLAMVAAREEEAARRRFDSPGAVAGFVARGAGSLMWAAARALGGPAELEPRFRAAGQGAGIANLLLALPGLAARGWQPLPAPAEDAVRALAETGLAALAEARRGAPLPVATLPALRAGWQAPALLRRARAQPERALEGRLALSEFRRRAGLLLRSFSARW